jgi:small subunit ribosomal protein S21
MEVHAGACARALRAIWKESDLFRALRLAYPLCTGQLSGPFLERTLMAGDPVQCKPVEVEVGERGVERAIKQLKRMMASEGIMRELKKRRSYMKPSVKRRKKQAEAERNRRKRARKQAEGRT